MKPALLLAALVLALATPAAPAQTPAKPHTFAIQGDHFALDGKPFKVISGELHYSRIPREYWHARLKMARAMGLNTVATYVFWNVHEPAPGRFDFAGQADLRAFILAAKEEGLYVILRAGPYSCGEWDFGGFPSWLLNDPRMSTALRSNDPAFMVPVERWINRIHKEVGDLQIGLGGPILVTQVENEYGSFASNNNDPDKLYMTHMRDIFVRAGFTSSLLDSVDGAGDLQRGSLPGLYTGVNFGIGSHEKGMDALAAFRPGQPLFVTEYWPGWFDAWGHPHQLRPTAPQLEDVEYILKRGAGINLYMFHGGTSFGFMSGADFSQGKYLPDVTSYDYGAPLDEAGHPTAKFLALRKILAPYATCTAGTGEACLPPVPDPPPVITIPAITLTQAASLWDCLPAPIASEVPLPMEHFGESFGYILYRTTLPAHASADLKLDELHDYAQIYLDEALIGKLDRRNRQSSLPIPASTRTAQLDILVENSARINFSVRMRTELKGITYAVTLAGTPLTHWQIYPLPADKLPSLRPVITHLHDGRVGPTLRRATFTLAATGDTFLDVRALGKGAVWINGHAIGRFWNIGPQQTLFVPRPWLHTGSNEILIFDLFSTANPPTVSGLDHPILDGPVPEQDSIIKD